MKTLTPRHALRLMADVVAEFGGGHVYKRVPSQGPCNSDGCLYLQKDKDGNDCPSCLVGHVLARWGLPLDLLSRWNGLTAYSLAQEMRHDNGVAFEILDEAVELLVVAQESQDSGEPWGTALAKAVGTFVNLED